VTTTPHFNLEREMNRLLGLLLPTALVAATAAMADPQTQATATVAPAAPAATAGAGTTVSPAVVKPDPQEKVICKREEETGSRLGSQKICMTKAQWDQQANSAQQYFRQRVGGGTNSH
jgi:hypothetical protein